MQTVQMVRLASIVSLMGLSALIVASSFEMSLGKGLAATVDTRWGITTMVDLYLGLLLIAGWIAYRERRVGRSLAWLLGLCLLGNFTALVYLLLASWQAKTIADLFQPVRR